jgi:amicyanin
VPIPMPRPRPSRRDLLRLAAALPAVRVFGRPLAAWAQEPANPVSLVASGLFNPRGFAWDAEGVLHVAQAGTGQPDEAASVVRIVDGCPEPVVTGQPSTRGMSGAVQGPGSVAFLDGQLYILQDSEDDRGDLAATQPNGVYRATADGRAELVADVTQWMIENPTKEIPYDRGKLGETFFMRAGDGFLWVVESNEGQVLKIYPDGRIERFVDLSEGHPVSTCLVPGPDGSVFVGNLSDAPYPTGKAFVRKVTAAGEVSEVWTGLTMVVGVDMTADGTLFALEMSTGNTTDRPFVRPNSGRLVKQTGPDALREVMSRLDFPIALATGPDGAFYVSGPALGSDGPAGWILRIDPAAEFLSVPAGIYGGGRCPGFAQARTALAAAEATQAAAPTPTPAPAGTPPANTAPVEIIDFKFVPGTLTIKTGRTVTWTNKDAIPHTSTSTATPKVWDSGNLNQDQSFSHTFDTAGTFDYICVYHPYMKGTVVVEE